VNGRAAATAAMLASLLTAAPLAADPAPPAPLELSWLWRTPADPGDAGEAGANLRGWREDERRRPGSSAPRHGYHAPPSQLPVPRTTLELAASTLAGFGPMLARNVDADTLLARYPASLPEELAGGAGRYLAITRAEASGPLRGPTLAAYVEAIDHREARQGLGAGAIETSWAPRYTGNLRWQPAPRLRLDAGARYDGLWVEDAGLSAWHSPSAARARAADELAVVIAGRAQPDPRTEVAAHYELVAARDDWRAAAGLATPGHHNLDTYQRWGNHPFTLRRRERRHRADLRGQRFADGLLAAGDAHTFSVGVQADLAARDEDETRNGGFTYVDLAAVGPDGTLPRRIDEADRGTWLLHSSDRGDEVHARLRQTAVALYLEDRAQLGPRLVITPGLRLERFRAGFADRGGPVWRSTTVAPRLAARWEVTGDGALAWFADAGRHYQHLDPSMYLRARAGAALSPLEYWDWTGDPAAAVLPGAQDPAWVRRRQFPAFLGDVAGDLRHPSVDRLATGVTLALLERGFDLTVRYEHRHHRHLLGLHDAGASIHDPATAPDGSYAPATQQFTAPDGTVEDVPFYDLRPGYEPHYQLGNPAGAWRRGHAAGVTARQRLGRLILTGTLTFTSDRGNLDAMRGLSLEWRDPSGTLGAEGNMPGFDRWAARAGGTFDLPWRLVADVDYVYRSGAYYSRLVRVSPTIAPRTYVYDERGRGGYRYPARHLLDLRLERTLPVAGPGRYRAFLRARNLLNAATVVAVREEAAYFESVQRLESPLEILVGVDHVR
jgi:hypothetical protein